MKATKRMLSNFRGILAVFLAFLSTSSFAGSPIYDNLEEGFDSSSGYAVGPVGSSDFVLGFEFTAQATGVVSSLDVAVSTGFLNNTTMTFGIYEGDASTLLEEISIIPTVEHTAAIETGVANGTTQLVAGKTYYLIASAVGQSLGWRKNSKGDTLKLFVSTDGGQSVLSERIDVSAAFRINSTDDGGTPAGLNGETVTLMGHGQETAASEVLTIDFGMTTVVEPGVEYPSIAAFDTQPTRFLVDTAINIGNDFLEIDFSNESLFTSYTAVFFNGYSLKVETSSIKFISANIDSGLTTIGLTASDITFTDNELFINMEGLGFNSSSFVRINFETMSTDGGVTPVVPELEVKIQELYIGILGRAGDRPGLDYWYGQIVAGVFTLENTRAAFTDPAQTEYTEIYGGLDNTQLVIATYENFLERAPEVAGLLYWVDELDNGRVNPDQMINAVINAVQDPNATGEQSAKDLATLENKIAAAIYFTEQTKAYSFDAAYREMARAVVASVTDDPETLTQAMAMIDEYVGN